MVSGGVRIGFAVRKSLLKGGGGDRGGEGKGGRGCVMIGFVIIRCVMRARVMREKMNNCLMTDDW